MSSSGLLDDGNIIGCFGTILARSWYIADDPPSNPDLGAQFEWLSLLLSDQNRIRAAGLHAAYCQFRSQITNDEFALKTLEEHHYNLQCRVTPIYRLPAEIMMEIFHFAIDLGQLRTGLMHVCRRWYDIIERLASLWTSLDLGAGTTPETVQHLLSRAGTHPLAVKIDIDNAISLEERLQPSLAMAGNKASQWQTLTVVSLPQGESAAQSNHALLPMQLEPMTQLRHLKITEPVLSPLLRLLLQNVTATAVGGLMSMEIYSFPSLQYLLQPGHSSIYCSLTTFIANVPKMNQPVDLLPHFMQLEVLELTNLLLYIVDNGSPLPLAHTLHHLYLKSVSIQWMGGQVFSQLENCTIIAPLTDSSSRPDVQLPACTKLHFENWNISPIGRFFAPVLDHMRVKGNVWSPYRGNRQVVQLVRAGFGTTLQPKSLSLSVSCKEKVLLAVLQLLPELVELRLDLPRPSALGKHFFTGLLAKPGNRVADNLRFDWRELFREDTTEWTCAICPYLRILELNYQQWLRPGYNDDFLPPLLALSWSREKIASPLQFRVFHKLSVNLWQSLNTRLSPLIEAISCPKIPRHGYTPKETLWTIAAFEGALIIPFLSRLQVVIITGLLTRGHLLNVLPSFHELKDLALSSVHVPPFDVDLPLVHTLRKLSLSNSTLAWMDGLVFTQLQKFVVDERGWPETFIRKVGMPACTHIVFKQDKLKRLPDLQYNFHLPLLNTWEFPMIWNHSEYDRRGISALQRIHAKAFKFRIFHSHLRLLELLGSKDEVEQLDLVLIGHFSGAGSEEPLTSLLMADHVTGKPHCPNMKVLGLRFLDENKEPIIQTCWQFMNNRRLAGYPMEKCYIWLREEDWEEVAPLVLVMENETVRLEG